MSDLHNYSGSWVPWRLADVAPAGLIDGANPNVSTQTIAIPERGLTSVSFQIAYAQIHNRSGGAANVGLGVRLPLAAWKAGQWTHGTTTYTDDTTDFQSAATTDAALETTTANSGFVVQSFYPFSAIEIDVGTSSAGTGPVRILEYSVAGGSWTTLTNPVIHSNSGSHYAAGTNSLIWWVPPADWAPIEGGHGTNLTVGMYGVRVRSTTPPGTTAGVADSISVHRIYWSMEGLADNAIYEVPLGGMYAPFDVPANALVAAFSVANPQNRATVLYRHRG